MELLTEISDGSLGRGFSEQMDRAYRLRKGARAVLLRDDGRMALMYLRNHYFHKLPGGGVGQGEQIEQALHREVREEVGCDMRVIAPLGAVIEYRDEHGLIQISYGYAAAITSALEKPTLEQNEIDQGMETLWVTPEEALDLFAHDKPNMYQGFFIVERELAFLAAFLAQV